MSNLPPLPPRRRHMFCTKCGYSNPDTSATENAPCENSNCQYFAFVRERDYDEADLRTFAEEAVRLEREQCAELCDHLWTRAGDADQCADAIRARSQEGQG